MASTATKREDRLSDEVKAELGVTEGLHNDLEEALEVLKAGPTIKEALGEKCVEAYLAHKSFEIKEARKMTWPERREMIVTSI